MLSCGELAMPPFLHCFGLPDDTRRNYKSGT